MNVKMVKLATRAGVPVPWGAWWQRKNLVVLVAHGGCDACAAALAALGRRAEELARDEVAAAIAVVPEEPEDVPPGVELLLDPDGRFAALVGARPGTVLASDRFFEVRGTYDVHERGPEAAIAAAHDRVELNELECPECGVGFDAR